MPRVKGFAVVEKLKQPQSFDPPLVMLVREHLKLNQLLEQILVIGKQAMHKPEKSRFDQWYILEQKLRKELECHLIKEDQVLLGLLSQYAEPHTGPIAVMKLEHEQIAKQLTLFERKLKLCISLKPNDKELIGEAYRHYEQLYSTLKDHMNLEEKSGYALSQNIFSRMDMQLMQRKFKKINSACKASDTVRDQGE